MLILVNESQLDEWVRSNGQDAQGVIVELVWRLVSASCPKSDRRFPLGDSNQQGPDGVLDNAVSFYPFVPEGCSYWEIGTGEMARDKATDDYNKLTIKVPERVRRDTTFIFVTPNSGRKNWRFTWKENDQAEWLDKRHKAREWKDVRVIDGTKLIDWVHQFPAVEMWLANKIGNIPEQKIDTPEQHWSMLSSIGEPPKLIPDLFLINRDEACAKLKDVLDDRVVQLKMTTHFPDQMIDFVSAYLASLDPENAKDAMGRCLIVLDADAWKKLCGLYKSKHILVADNALDMNGDAGVRLIQKARQAGHAIIFSGPLGGAPDPSSIPLQMPRTDQVKDMLVKAGYEEERARALAQKTGGNLGVLLRCLQNLSLMPEWAEKTEAAELAIAALLGSWFERSEADCKIVESLSGKAYGEWIEEMRKVALRPGTPLAQKDGNWIFLVRYEGWYALGPRLFDEHLDRLLDVAVQVFQENDPQFELPPEERYAAAIYGKKLPHSRQLRTGLAESLALLGGHPKALKSCSIGKAESTAVYAVRNILEDADWVRWASLNDLLPLLAESAPGAFLDVVEKALCLNPCPFDELFSQENGGVFGRSYIAGLIWAFETLAWDSDYLAGAASCLGKLAARDPGGPWANRPEKSLTAIFLPWLPQTCASIKKRLAVIDILLAEQPEVGWKLLLSLLPQSHSASRGTRRPAWRATIPESWRQSIANHEYWEQVSAYSDLAVTIAKKDFNKFTELIGYLERLTQPAREQFLKQLMSDSIKTMPEPDRLNLWNELVDLVKKHKKYSDAPWAIEPDQVEMIEKIADRLAPNDPFFRYQRLFSERGADLFEEKGNYEEQIKVLENRRQQAVKEIAAIGDIMAILSFVNAVQSSWRVGIAYGIVAGKEADSEVLPDLLESSKKKISQFIGGFIRGRFNSHGWQWVDFIITTHWTSSQIGQFLSFLPFSEGTWERARRLLGKDESAYWSITAANPYDSDTGLERAVDQLINNGRPFAAIRCLYMMLHKKRLLDKKQAVRALLEARNSSETPHAEDYYDIIEIIKVLQSDPKTNPDDLYRVEWAYLELLNKNSDTSPKTLEMRLAKEPGFFCEAIRLVFKSKNEKRSTDDISEEKKSIASSVYGLLNSWRIPPGLCEDGSYDGDALKAWLEEVKKECKKTGHFESAMAMLGHVLIYVPSDPDGLWIHRSAAAALNAEDAESLRSGFRTGLNNSRGVYWGDSTGKAELNLATGYRTKAEAVEEAGYHRLAACLRKIAETYEREAEWIVSREPFDD